MKLGIVIINWNGTEDTIECLESICKYHSFEETEIFIVDNNSTKPIEKLFECKKWCQFHISIIENDKNEGFAKANNIGVALALSNNCDYILLLNNDTTIIDDSIANAINSMRDHKFHIVGLVNYYYDQPEKIWQAGWNIDNHNLKHQNLVNNYKGIIDVDYVPGSSLLTTKDVINSINLFDENYFAYWEETDFCFRAKKNGYKVGFLNDSKILHKVGRSSNSSVQEYLFNRNRLYFYQKNFTNFNFLYPILLMKSIKKILQLLLKFKYKPIRSIIMAYKDFHFKKFGKGSLDQLI